MQNTQLNKTEQKESMMMTWGRIRTAVTQNNRERVIELVEKFNKDLQRAKVEENYFSE